MFMRKIAINGKVYKWKAGKRYVIIKHPENKQQLLLSKEVFEKVGDQHVVTPAQIASEILEWEKAIDKSGF